MKGAVNKAGKVKETKESQDSLDIYCPKCKKKHVLHEFPLNKIEICGLYQENHKTNDCECLTVAKISLVSMIGDASFVAPRGNNNAQDFTRPSFHP